jgi:hypothetical protein
LRLADSSAAFYAKSVHTWILSAANRRSRHGLRHEAIGGLKGLAHPCQRAFLSVNAVNKIDEYIPE